MKVTTHLQLECEPLQKLDPNYELAFFTRDLFAKMHKEFGVIPKEVFLDTYYTYLLFIRYGDKSLSYSAYCFNDVRDSLNKLGIKWNI